MAIITHENCIFVGPDCANTPPQRGTLFRNGIQPVPLHWKGGGCTDGVVREFKYILLVYLVIANGVAIQ